MRRRDLLGALGAAIAFGAPGIAFAQAKAKVWRIGFLVSGTEASHGASLRALQEALRKLGYVEGEHYILDVRWAEAQMERVPRLAADLVRAKPDLVVTASIPLVRAVHEASKTMPIVMASGANPVDFGLAASLARPGGAVTGLTNMSTETTGKLVELAHELVPKASTVALLLSDHPVSPAFLADAQKAGKALKIAIVSAYVRNAGEIDAAFGQVAKLKANAFVMPADTLLLALRKPIVERAARAKLPGVYPRREAAEEGGLLSYGLNLEEMYRRAATYVERILKGAKPGELAIEQPRTFELVINKKTARALGLSIPQAVLLRADRVIE